MKKIYIIGSVGAGKTTLAKKISKKYEIPMYQLDKVVWDDDNGNIKRSDEEIQKLFEEILDKGSWIIEDVGRSKFEEGRKQADIIYYINIPKIVVYKRVMTRWLKQRLGKERYNYPPTLFQFFDMLKTTRGYFKKEKSKKESLLPYKNKVIYLNYKDLNELEN
jgi:adenylate kinase family enzyme